MKAFLVHTSSQLFTLYISLTTKTTTSHIYIMSGYSNVGNRGVYEAGDQRNVSEAERKAQESDPYNEGKENSHSNLDSSKNSRTKKRKDLTLTNIRRG